MHMHISHLLSIESEIFVFFTLITKQIEAYLIEILVIVISFTYCNDKQIE